MDAFERARKKYEKNKERNARYESQEPEKKDTPKVEKKIPPTMTVVVSGPANLSFTVDYASTLTSGQANPDALKAAFTRQLSVFGKVL